MILQLLNSLLQHGELDNQSNMNVWDLLWGALLAVIVHPRLPDSNLLASITYEVGEAVHRAVANGHKSQIFGRRYSAIKNHVSQFLNNQKDAGMQEAFAAMSAPLLLHSGSLAKHRAVKAFVEDMEPLLDIEEPTSGLYQGDQMSRTSTQSLIPKHLNGSPGLGRVGEQAV